MHAAQFYNHIINEGVLQIFSSSPKFESLDFSGCCTIKHDSIYVNQNFMKLMVLGPRVLGYYEMLDDCLDILDSFDSEYDDIDVDKYDYYDDNDESDDDIWYLEGGIEEFDFKVYVGGIEDTSMYWPPSP